MTDIVAAILGSPSAVGAGSILLPTILTIRRDGRSEAAWITEAILACDRLSATPEQLCLPLGWRVRYQRELDADVFLKEIAARLRQIPLIAPPEDFVLVPFGCALAGYLIASKANGIPGVTAPYIIVFSE